MRVYPNEDPYDIKMYVTSHDIIWFLDVSVDTVNQDCLPR